MQMVKLAKMMLAAAVVAAGVGLSAPEYPRLLAVRAFE